jgi:enoyl-[acyl-carrier protein] reductase I
LGIVHVSLNEESKMGFMQGKRVLIVGLASKRSIAYGIAEAMHREGAELAFSYQNEKLKGRVEDMASAWGSDLVFPCDVSSDQQIESLFDELGKRWDGLDSIIHSVAFAPKELLEGDHVNNMTREGFNTAHEISVYSFTALAKAGQQLMAGRNGSLLTLSYLGAERVVPNYNVMGLAKASLEANVRYMAQSMGKDGIRVNAVSAGPIRTLAASGIKGFRKMLDYNEKVAPMQTNVTIEDVGNAAAFLCSGLAAGITGEVVHVDAGYHCMGMGLLD